MSVLLFDPITHTYTVDGVKKISVTQVFNRVATRSNDKDDFQSVSGSEFYRFDESRDFGNEFHKVAGFTVSDVSCSYDPVMQPWVNGLNKFLTEKELMDFITERNFADIYDVEKPLYSKKYDYVGTLDWFFSNIGTALLIDWKTGTIMPKLARYQTAAYLELIKENYGLRSNAYRWTVRIFENGYELEIRKPSDQQSDFNKFLSLLNVYKSFSKGMK